MLTVDFERLGLASRRAPARPRFRWRPARVRGDAPRRARRPRSTTRPPTSKTSPRSPGAMLEAGETSVEPVGRRRERRRARPAVPRRRLRPRDRLRGARTHLGRRARDHRDRARAAARRPHRGHRADPLARARDLGAQLPLPRHARRARAHLPPARARSEARTRRLLPARLASRARVPLAVLVVEVRVRARQPRRRAGEALPRLPVPPASSTTRAGRASTERALNPVLGKSLVVYGEKVPPTGAKWGKRSLG